MLYYILLYNVVQKHMLMLYCVPLKCSCRKELLILCCVVLQSASNLLNRFRGSDSNLYQRNLEAQAMLAQQQALGLGIHGLSSQTALDLLQVCSNNTGLCSNASISGHVHDLL